MFIALRELRRSIGRFLLLTGAVALLVLLLLFFQSVAGALTLGITGGVENNSADVLVYSDRARQNPAASFLSADAAPAVARVAGVGRVAEVGRATVGAAVPVRGPSAEEATAEGEAGEDVVVVGLGDLSFGGPDRLDEGRRAETDGEAVFSGSSLSDGFEVGDVVLVEGVELTVVGRSDDAAFDVSPTFYVPTAALAEIVTSRAGAPVDAPISWLAVEAADGVDPADVAAEVNALGFTGPDGAGIEALERSAAAGALPGADQITQSFGILYLLLFIVVTIVTGVFFLILTVQKQRSLVLLRAVGASRWDVVKPVLAQVAIVVLGGCAVGVAAAAGLLRLAQDVFGSSLDPRTTVATVAFLFVLAILASLGAIRRVLAIDPLEATTSGTI